LSFGLQGLPGPLVVVGGGDEAVAVEVGGVTGTEVEDGPPGRVMVTPLAAQRATAAARALAVSAALQAPWMQLVDVSMNCWFPQEHLKSVRPQLVFWTAVKRQDCYDCRIYLVIYYEGYFLATYSTCREVIERLGRDGGSESSKSENDS